MRDRDSLYELFDIVLNEAEQKALPLTASALPAIRARFSIGCDVYYRRRLSVCRMLIDLHLPVTPDMLDIMLAVALSHSLPGDSVPDDHRGTMEGLFAAEPRVAEILSVLCYSGDGYYARLAGNRYALLIRLTERGVLVESLYEWPAEDARRYIRETCEHFFPMCIYAKEHYRELLGPLSILMEKTRNLVAANEALLRRYEEAESARRSEILSLMEENAALRAMIREMEEAKEERAL